MSEPYELLSKEAIGAWLKGLEVRGNFRKKQKKDDKRITLYTLARYLGTTRDELKWRSITPSMSTDRQRLFSKVIAQIENGQLVVYFDPITKNKSLAPPVGAPVPSAPKYAADFSGGGAGLKPVARVKPLAEMPQFGALLTKRK